LRKGSLIDDVEVDFGIKGPPICFPNYELRSMLRLGKANRDDILFDLGSGWGQTIMIALTEFGVSKAVGFEKDDDRLEKALRRRDNWLKQRQDIEAKRWHIVDGDFEYLLRRGELKGESLKDATLIFYGLSSTPDVLRAIRKAWKGTEGRRILYYHNCLFPEIMPSRTDFPFLVSKFPFTRPKTEAEWLAKVSGKKKSSIDKGRLATEEELWDELGHDYDLSADPEAIPDYKQRLRRSVRRGIELGSLIF
jgi:hypothetical protein